MDELDQHYDLELDREEVDTVGGLIMTLLGRVPEVGDMVSQDGVELTVQSVDGMAVQTALIQLPRRHDGSLDDTEEVSEPDSTTFASFGDQEDGA